MGELKYRKAFEKLRDEILSGKYASRKPFPSLVATCARFRISRLTAVKVFDKLKEEKLISSRVGAGTFVTGGAKSRFVGLVIPGIAYASEFFQPIVAEFVRLAKDRDYTIVMDGVWSSQATNNGHEAIEVAARLIRRRVAGVIYQPLEHSVDSETINRHLIGRGVRSLRFHMRTNWVENVMNRAHGVLMKTLASLGHRVPDDVQVAGFDDVQIARLSSPGITTVHQPCEGIARSAFDRLLTRMFDPTLTPVSLVLPHMLVVRGSTRRPERTIGRTRRGRF